MATATPSPRILLLLAFARSASAAAIGTDFVQHNVSFQCDTPAKTATVSSVQALALAIANHSLTCVKIEAGEYDVSDGSSGGYMSTESCLRIRRDTPLALVVRLTSVSNPWPTHASRQTSPEPRPARVSGRERPTSRSRAPHLSSSDRLSTLAGARSSDAQRARPLPRRRGFAQDERDVCHRSPR